MPALPAINIALLCDLYDRAIISERHLVIKQTEIRV